MKIETVERGGVKCAVVRSGEPLITDAQSALDLLMDVKYQTGTKNLVLDKRAVAEDFFVLSTGLAGEILQKFINYGARVAIYGDFSRYTSKPLHDFIYESNNGRDAFFAATEAEAVDRITR